MMRNSPEFVKGDPRSDKGNQAGGRLEVEATPDDASTRARYEHQLEKEAAGRKPWPLERFRRWFSDRF
jgi:hypothetical protein